METTRITGREAIEIHRQTREPLRETGTGRRTHIDEAFWIIGKDPAGVYVDEAETVFGADWRDGEARKTVTASRAPNREAVYTAIEGDRRALLQEVQAPDEGWLVSLGERKSVQIFRRRGLKHLDGMCARWVRGRPQLLQVDVFVDDTRAGRFFAREAEQITRHLEERLPGWKIGSPVYAVPFDSREVMSGPANRVRIVTEPYHLGS